MSISRTHEDRPRRCRRTDVGAAVAPTWALPSHRRGRCRRTDVGAAVAPTWALPSHRRGRCRRTDAGAAGAPTWARESDHLCCPIRCRCASACSIRRASVTDRARGDSWRHADRSRSGRTDTAASSGTKDGRFPAGPPHRTPVSSQPSIRVTAITLSTTLRSISSCRGSMPARAGCRGTITVIVCSPLRIRCRCR